VPTCVHHAERQIANGALNMVHNVFLRVFWANFMRAVTPNMTISYPKPKCSLRCIQLCKNMMLVLKYFG
jgi:hypothetical protein